LLGYVPSVLQPWSTVQNCPVPSLGDSVLLAGVWVSGLPPNPEFLGPVLGLSVDELSPVV
ncbi:unnamed protein product, partial [Tilletia laevis]